MNRKRCWKVNPEPQNLMWQAEREEGEMSRSRKGSPSPEPADKVILSTGQGRFKDNGATNHYQNNYVHLKMTWKSRIKLLYKFPTNEKMRAGIGSGVEYPLHKGSRGNGNQYGGGGAVSALNYTLNAKWGSIKHRENTKAQRLKNKNETTHLPLKIICKHNT